jgi:hypothetical protein
MYGTLAIIMIKHMCGLNGYAISIMLSMTNDLYEFYFFMPNTQNDFLFMSWN